MLLLPLPLSALVLMLPLPGGTDAASPATLPGGFIAVSASCPRGVAAFATLTGGKMRSSRRSRRMRSPTLRAWTVLKQAWGRGKADGSENERL